jgi:hypothetical protein
MLSSASAAAADEWTATWFPGAARAIPRTTSASRDTALLEYTAGIDPTASAGAEPGILTMSLGGPEPVHEFHVGIYGLVALESLDEGSLFPHEFWRGLFGVTFTYAPLGLARRLFGPGAALEVGFVLGHESDHTTDDIAVPGGVPGGSLDAADLYQDFIGVDVGWRIPIRRTVTVVGRLTQRANPGELFVSISAVDLELRLVTFARVQPFVSAYGELWLSAGASQSCPSGRALVGIALPGKFGEASAFASFDGGCDKGLLYKDDNLRVTGGLRYTPF